MWPEMPSTDSSTALYTQAVQSIKAIQANEPAALLPSGRTQFMTHGYRVERAAVMFHGYTSAPQQFHALGLKLFALGYNVYIPRAPHHGLPDPLAGDHADLTAEEIKAAAQRALEITLGLGERVNVLGLSMGGLMAGWLAQYRTDVNVAMIIAPAFGFRVVPRPLLPLIRAAALRLPNVFRWWDPELKGDGGGPRHAYARYATRGLAQVMRVSSDLATAARRSAPAARSLVVVTNANDESVDNAATARVVAHWRARGAVNIATYEFPKSQQLIHDLIDPEQPRQRVDHVYKILIDLLHQSDEKQ